MISSVVVREIGRSEVGSPAFISAGPETPADEISRKDARRRKRLRVSLPLHVQPFDVRFAELEDVGEVVDFSRDGLYFLTCMPHYSMGMRLIVKFPYGRQVAAPKKFLGEVVRLDQRADGTLGIAVRFLV
jgi:hypothetical protein